MSQTAMPIKPKFDFDNAGDIKQKIKNLEEGIARAKVNYDLFTAEATKQVDLQKTLQEELAILKLQAQQQGVNLEEN
ncbi:hypothetical protein A2W32_01805 [candidate division WWE3 bacterium RBG_16_37_10]|uniref:Uncharacterized protein n=1 Tax=candidate division WWE3 bacterium RBG_16_37_10 TaxID=1802610 RepID=A0A1F4UW65_UNCKA|nr:MAG: hypothetical protein A2W32_01805 [candidate division WWE3 bacterium RBG_16_37_10]